jgi:hypothetical protein
LTAAKRQLQAGNGERQCINTEEINKQNKDEEK